MSACGPCNPGTFANETMSSVCLSCTPGRYSPDSNASACSECGHGEYQEKAAQTTCTPCPDHTTQTTIAARDIFACMPNETHVFFKYNTTFTLKISVKEFENQRQFLQLAFASFFEVKAIFVALQPKPKQQRRLLQTEDSVRIEVTVSYESEAAKNEALSGKTLQILEQKLKGIEVSSDDDAWQTTPTPGPSPSGQGGDTNTPSDTASGGGGGDTEDSGNAGVLIGIAAGVVVLLVVVGTVWKIVASRTSLLNASPPLVQQPTMDPTNYYVSIAPIEATTQQDV